MPIRVLRIGQETAALLDIVLATGTAFWIHRRLVIVIAREFVGRPLPHVANHIVQTVIVLLVKCIHFVSLVLIFEKLTLRINLAPFDTGSHHCPCPRRGTCPANNWRDRWHLPLQVHHPITRFVFKVSLYICSSIIELCIFFHYAYYSSLSIFC